MKKILRKILKAIILTFLASVFSIVFGRLLLDKIPFIAVYAICFIGSFIIFTVGDYVYKDE